MSNTPVKQNLEESLSALMDGEATELELRRLLKASDDDYEVLRSRWAGFHAASSSIKKDVPSVKLNDISLSIRDAIDSEPAHSYAEKEPVSKIQSIWSGVGRFAVAASVAGAVIVGVQFSPDSSNNQIVDSAPALNSSQISGSFNQSLPSNTAVSTVSNEVGGAVVEQERPEIIITEGTKQQLIDAEERVNRLLLEHAQNGTQNTQQGVLSYERVPESK